MARESLNTVVQYLHRIVETTSELSDAELLERFARRRDESAFSVLVWRHGPLVFGLCRRLLRHEQDSEDAFQATFLALARKADSIGKKEALASWLYKVAYRIACRVRARVSLQTNQAALDIPAPVSESNVIWRDLREVLDQEVARLPEAYSRAIVLCYLEGKTHEEAARLLGCPKGTLASNLARARDRLRERLTRRGIALSTATLTAVLAEEAAGPALAAELVYATTHAALAFTSGSMAVGVFSANAAVLAEGVLQIMWISKMKSLMALALFLVLAGSGLLIGARGFLEGRGAAESQAPGAAAKAPALKAPEPQTDAKDVAALRQEIAKLRTDLDAAMREIKDLRGALKKDAGVRDPGPLYRGKTVQFWLDQLKDGDPAFRTEAVIALGTLVSKKKELASVLLESMKDPDYDVARTASNAVSKLGPEVMPALVEMLRDKASPASQRWAASSIADLGPRAKSAIKPLADALKTEDKELRRIAAIALGKIGPDAKPAIPALIDLVEVAIKANDFFPKVQFLRKSATSVETRDPPGAAIIALTEIDPDLKAVYYNLRGIKMKDSKDFNIGKEGFLKKLTREEELIPWQQAIIELRAKYPKEK